MPGFQNCLVGWLWKRPNTGSLPATDMADTVAVDSADMLDTVANIVAGAVRDLRLSKRELILENALLRQQLVVLRRQIQRPQLTSTDRALLVVLASRLRS